MSQFSPHTENKLNKLKTKSSVLKQLTERREECMEKLLSGAIDLPPTELDYDDNSNRPSAQFVRHIIPEQALNSGELIHIIKHDQLAVSPTPTESTEDVNQSKPTDLEN